MRSPGKLAIECKSQKYKTLIIANIAIYFDIWVWVQSWNNSKMDRSRFFRWECEAILIRPISNIVNAGLKFVFNYCKIAMSVSKLEIVYIYGIMVPTIIWNRKPFLNAESAQQSVRFGKKLLYSYFRNWGTSSLTASTIHSSIEVLAASPHLIYKSSSRLAQLMLWTSIGIPFHASLASYRF